MLHIERGADGALAVHTGEGTINKDRAEKVLELLVDEKLHDLVPKMWYVETPSFRLRDRPMTVTARGVLGVPFSGLALNFVERLPEVDIVQLRV